MSQKQALEIIQLYYAMFNRGDREGMLALLAPDVVHEVNQGASELGREAFRAFLQRMDASYAEQVKDLVILVQEAGNRAAAEFFIDGTYLKTDAGLPEASGQKYWLRVGAFFELREGRISRVTNYYNLEDWLRQVKK
jgi:steroid delta-isomerase-like uncharacterized protein